MSFIWLLICLAAFIFQLKLPPKNNYCRHVPIYPKLRNCPTLYLLTKRLYLDILPKINRMWWEWKLFWPEKQLRSHPPAMMQQQMWRVCKASWHPPGCNRHTSKRFSSPNTSGQPSDWPIWFMLLTVGGWCCGWSHSSTNNSCNFPEDLDYRRSIGEMSNPRKEDFCWSRVKLCELPSYQLFYFVLPSALNFFS